VLQPGSLVLPKPASRDSSRPASDSPSLAANDAHHSRPAPVARRFSASEVLNVVLNEADDNVRESDASGRDGHDPCPNARGSIKEEKDPVSEKSRSLLNSSKDGRGDLGNKTTTAAVAEDILNKDAVSCGDAHVGRIDNETTSDLDATCSNDFSDSSPLSDNVGVFAHSFQLDCDENQEMWFQLPVSMKGIRF